MELYQWGWARGEESELIVGRELQELVNNGKLSSYHRAERHSEDDLNGIDYYMIAHQHGGPITIPLQVKSSEAGIQSGLARHPDIPIVNGRHPGLYLQLCTIISDWLKPSENVRRFSPVKHPWKSVNAKRRTRYN